MRRRILLSLAVLLVPACGFAYAYWTSYVTDDFDAYLQKMGYSPLHPARNEFHLGSLYDIDDSGNFDLVCPTTKAMVENYVGPDTQNIDRETTGSFSVIGDVANRLKATAGDEYSKHVKLSLRDIRLQQIPASKDGEIQDTLISDRACLRAVTNRLRLGHYICQVQSSFSAVAAYEIDNALSSSATAKKALTQAVEAHTKMQAKESGNSVLTGGDLVFGVKLEPVCISPLHAIFIRTWPQSAFGRGIDFVKYDVIEPLFVKDLFGEEAEQRLASE